jgi:predicted enzyme related to lactoylglutathione lyase
MRLSAIRIPCSDLGESAQFYEHSIGLKKAFGSIDEGFVGFQLENAQVLIEQQEHGEFECGRYLGFSVEVEDIFGFHTLCKKRGVTFTGPPEKQIWGGLMTHIEDCSGNTFSVVQRAPAQ